MILNYIRMLFFMTSGEKLILAQLKKLKTLRIDEYRVSVGPEEIYNSVYKKEELK